MNFFCGYIKEYKNSPASKIFFGVCVCVYVCKGFYELLLISQAQQFIIFLKIDLHFLNNSRYLPYK